MSSLALTCALVVSAVSPLDVGVQERLDEMLPKDVLLHDEAGGVHTLGDALTGDEPTLLTLAYYRCPMLCNIVLRGVADAVRAMELRPGRDYRLATISFAPEDTPESAARKGGAARDEARVDREHWPFYTTDAQGARELLQAVGMDAVRDATTGDWAHPAVIFVVTPSGRLARYLYGTTFPPDAVSAAVVAATHGQTSTGWRGALLRCLAWDAASRRHGPFIALFMRLGAVTILCGAGGGLAFLWRRERQRRRAA